jgi:hypothetical protein
MQVRSDNYGEDDVPIQRAEKAIKALVRLASAYRYSGSGSGGAGSSSTGDCAAAEAHEAMEALLAASPSGLAWRISFGLPLPPGPPPTATARAAMATWDSKFLPVLNPSQQAAFVNAHRNRVSVLRGPPGTGKTRTIAAITESFVDAGQRVLLLAPANAATKRLLSALHQHGYNQVALMVAAEYFHSWFELAFSGVLPNVVNPVLANESLLHDSDTAADRTARRHEHTAREAGLLSREQIEIARAASLWLDTSGRVKQQPLVNILTFGSAAIAQLGLSKWHSGVQAELVGWDNIDAVIVDESSQLWEGHLHTLASMFPRASHFIIVGDDKQLPPFGSATCEGSRSLFDAAISHPSVPLQQLEVSYRLPVPVGGVLSTALYGGALSVQRNPRRDAFIQALLQQTLGGVMGPRYGAWAGDGGAGGHSSAAADSCAGEVLTGQWLRQWPLYWHHAADPYVYQSPDTKSLASPQESRLIAEVACTLLPVVRAYPATLLAAAAASCGAAGPGFDPEALEPPTMVIITPYEQNRQDIEGCLAEAMVARLGYALDDALQDIRSRKLVVCIDGYQGQEADFVLISLVRQKGLGFIEDDRRANVMLSRCRQAMLVVGNMNAVATPALSGRLVGRFAELCLSNGWTNARECGVSLAAPEVPRPPPKRKACSHPPLVHSVGSVEAVTRAAQAAMQVALEPVPAALGVGVAHTTAAAGLRTSGAAVSADRRVKPGPGFAAPQTAAVARGGVDVAEQTLLRETLAAFRRLQTSATPWLLASHIGTLLVSVPRPPAYTTLGKWLNRLAQLGLLTTAITPGDTNMRYSLTAAGVAAAAELAASATHASAGVYSHAMVSATKDDVAAPPKQVGISALPLALQSLARQTLAAMQSVPARDVIDGVSWWFPPDLGISLRTMRPAQYHSLGAWLRCLASEGLLQCKRIPGRDQTSYALAPGAAGAAAVASRGTVASADSPVAAALNAMRGTTAILRKAARTGTTTPSAASTIATVPTVGSALALPRLPVLADSLLPLRQKAIAVIRGLQAGRACAADGLDWVPYHAIKSRLTPADRPPQYKLNAWLSALSQAGILQQGKPVGEKHQWYRVPTVAAGARVQAAASGRDMSAVGTAISAVAPAVTGAKAPLLAEPAAAAPQKAPFSPHPAFDSLPLMRTRTVEGVRALMATRSAKYDAAGVAWVPAQLVGHRVPPSSRPAGYSRLADGLASLVEAGHLRSTHFPGDQQPCYTVALVGPLPGAAAAATTALVGSASRALSSAATPATRAPAPAATAAALAAAMAALTIAAAARPPASTAAATTSVPTPAAAASKAPSADDATAGAGACAPLAFTAQAASAIRACLAGAASLGDQVSPPWVALTALGSRLPPAIRPSPSLTDSLRTARAADGLPAFAIKLEGPYKYPWVRLAHAF